jgi:hypothetical protein
MRFKMRICHDTKMIFGAHMVLFSSDADADRSFLRRSVRIRGNRRGWRMVDLRPTPTQVAVHPADTPGAALYLTCDDLSVEMEALTQRGVSFSNVEEARWGSVAMARLPGGGEVGLYEPRHPLALRRES